MLSRAHGRAAGQNQGRPELADIFRQYRQSYAKTHRLSAAQQKVMRAVETCRTAELGGHLKQCDTCGFEHPTYNSCRSRHCPKCQSLAKAKWLEKQISELLPVGYFHLVFALPHEFYRLILAHKKIGLSLLFKAVSETLLEFGRRRFGGTVGIIAVLHTWDQTLEIISIVVCRCCVSLTTAWSRQFSRRSRPVGEDPDRLQTVLGSQLHRSNLGLCWVEPRLRGVA